MNKKLAIKGHPTRGKEVIELLEMMGGNNRWGASGVLPNLYYFISNKCIIYSSQIEKDVVIFTLEEFLEKYPYKVGDKIPDVWGNSCTVKSMSWDENYKTVMYGFEETIFVVRGDELYMTNIINNHTKPSKMKNVLAELLEHIKTTPKEDLEREFEEIKEWSNVGPTIEEFRTFCECVNKKPVYPKTYEECCKITEDVADASLTCFACNLLNNFQKLLLCRDAYWEIVGEEMKMGKLWEPDWDNLSTNHEFIKINKGCFTYSSRVLVFPTEEMRDAFYENFRDLIESCKELL